MVVAERAEWIWWKKEREIGVREIPMCVFTTIAKIEFM